MPLNFNRIISIGIGVIIVFYGTFGKQLWPYYQFIVEALLSEVSIADKLMVVFKGAEDEPHDVYNLGRYLIYCPSYFFLHLLLINSLFWNNSRALSYGNFIFIGFLSVLLASILFAYFLHLNTLYDVLLGLMNKSLRLPMILFIVEGGRILLKDINKNLSLPEEF